ncbi:phenylalanine--tRNA ligase subunit alpha [Candidatus Gottesmanbacteria bacterium RBG_16_52_11]|uniref:phenylalanine--tRNA ligase n=1 Tax=Candidatus Gottesmanbacteria bacterium RBG_16_52_11 TaxID=1798374 RepID=A0A1F5YPX1_9BACT|nr:MAG: phenylalanine--tRNA ligase subunit alpha [Candidatus Gottesmanbacteria bacterium RBG_16_52_11]
MISLLLEVQSSAFSLIDSHERSADDLRIRLLGSKSPLTGLTRKIRSIPKSDASRVGIVANEVKKSIEQKLSGYIRPELLNREAAASPDLPDSDTDRGYFDPTEPGSSPPVGHLHIVSQAITEITDIFARIGFSRVRHPEVDWDWYAFESLNMPLSHPARDEWETFFIEYPGTRPPEKGKFTRIVLTPHTSNGQVREMEKGELPIRMINIAKCYRRQSDVSHTPMFHQFEGLYVDRGVSIAHLKGVIMYFARSFYGSDREIRLRPFHFQFTEPSFEIDVSCGICHGKGVPPGGSVCRLCKSGWLELGGAGMVHPNVLKAAGIDPKIYNGFAFGWGVERTYMMKSGTKIDDLRILYGNDIRFLEQF